MARQPIVIDFWDVGQGDATVIRPTPHQAIMIDVGPRNSPTVDWILLNPKIKIEALVLTHSHADHVGALNALIDGAAARIECVYFLQDDGKKGGSFAKLFERLDRAVRFGELKRVLRLEAPQIVWRDPTGTVELEVKYPAVLENIPATLPNLTAGILVLSANKVVKVLWASDAPIEMAARHASGTAPDFLIGPHHGAPTDRAHPAAEGWLRSIGAGTTLLSVGSFNRYSHPQKSYIRKSLRAGSRIMCTQLTKLCDKNWQADVVKSHARYTLPKPNTGIACRGPVRVKLLSTDDLIGDDLDALHQAEIQKLDRPQCRRLAV